MFQVIGDVVEFEGWPICTLRADIPATVRERLELELHHDRGDLERELESLQSDYDDMDSRLCRTQEELHTMTGQRDAYAAILGVTT